MTGSKKGPDYGSPPSSPWYALAICAAIAAIGFWFLSVPRYPPKDCWTLSNDEIQTFERDGKTVATLDLRRVPPGDCVTIDTGGKP